MDQFNQTVYEELLADNRFVLWATGKNPADDAYWEQWKKRHPDALDSFHEALSTVQLFKFKAPEISSEEVSARWLQSKGKMKLRLSPQVTSGPVYWYGRIAGILLVPVLLVSLWLFYNQRELKFDLNQISRYSGEKSIRVGAPLGGQLHLELPDGSKAWLNAGSAIHYPPYFSQGKREVEIAGEIYFEVAESNKPFVVKTPGPVIKVYGTEFNVHAYPDEKDVTVALAKGKIALENHGKEVMMTPGEVATFDRTSERLTKQHADTYLYTSWREGKYIFRDTPLELILKTLERTYQVTISLEDSSMKRFTYDATINGEPLEQILELLTFSGPLKYDYKKPRLQADGSFSKAEVRLWRDQSKRMNPLK